MERPRVERQLTLIASLADVSKYGIPVLRLFVCLFVCLYRVRIDNNKKRAMMVVVEVAVV